MSARYLVNAGRLERGSWYLDEEREGSRFAGEGGHFIDTLSALVGHQPVEVYAMGSGGNVHATLRFADGSVGTIAYLTDGSPRFPKETLDVTGDGRNGRLDNFQRVTVWSATGKSGHRVLTGQDKGQRAQLERFVHAVRTGAGMPIPFDSLVATTRATLAVGDQPVSREAGGLVSRPSPRLVPPAAPRDVGRRACSTGPGTSAVAGGLGAPAGPARCRRRPLPRGTRPDRAFAAPLPRR